VTSFHNFIEAWASALPHCRKCDRPSESARATGLCWLCREIQERGTGMGSICRNLSRNVAG
jgi:ribosomal protein L37AE/L43A